MRLPKWALALVLALLLSSLSCCVPSLQPLYKDGQPIFEPALLGTWSAKNCSERDEFKDQNCTVTISQYDAKDDRGNIVNRGYTLAFRAEDGKESELRAYLIPLGKFRFLDTAYEDSDTIDPVIGIHMLPVHVFWKVTVEGKTLNVWRLNFEWFQKLKGEHRLSIRYEVMDGDVLLTAAPEESQGFLQEHANEKDFFESPIVWQRK